jgi:hypothetical protein
MNYIVTNLDNIVNQSGKPWNCTFVVTYIGTWPYLMPNT